MDRISKGVIPAAGLGSRMLSLGMEHPKEMLPLGGKPMIYYAVCEAALSGVEELYIVINDRKKSIRSYLESEEIKRDLQAKSTENEISSLKLTFVEQPIPSGSGDAIYRVRRLIGEEPFALMMPDFLFFGSIPALKQMIPVYCQFERDTVGVLHLKGEEAIGFGNVGIIEGREGEGGIVEIRSISGKVQDPLILKEDERIFKGVGRWILGPHFFSYLEEIQGSGEEWDDTPALQLNCKEKGVLGKVLEGTGFDAGNPLGYKAAEAFVQRELDAFTK
jgi:UTP--glucose-1-phosphate uridylyltransferase